MRRGSGCRLASLPCSFAAMHFLQPDAQVLWRTGGARSHPYFCANLNRSTLEPAGGSSMGGLAPWPFSHAMKASM